MVKQSVASTFSVIIPAYNAEKYISRALDSVLAQTYPAHQIIVINDGSKDGTADIIEKYGDRISVISIPNGGVSNARNTGLKHVTGDLVALLDADDLWRPEKLARQAEVFANNPDVEFTCCNYLATEESTGISVEKFASLAQDRPPFFDRVLPRPVDLLLALNFVGTCSNVVFTRGLLQKVGLFDVTLKQAEDFELWLRMALEANFYLQSDVLVEKIAHDANLTTRFDETLKYHEQVILRFRQTHGRLFEQSRGLDRVYRRGLSDLRYDISGVLFHKGARAEGFAYLRSAWVAYPYLSNGRRILKRVIRRSILRTRR